MNNTDWLRQGTWEGSKGGAKDGVNIIYCRPTLESDFVVKLWHSDIGLCNGWYNEDDPVSWGINGRTANFVFGKQNIRNYEQDSFKFLYINKR